MPEIKCKRCDRRYSSIYRKCPYCGQKRTRGGKHLRRSGTAIWVKFAGTVCVLAFVAAVAYFALPMLGISWTQEPVTSPDVTSEVTDPPEETPGATSDTDVVAPDISGDEPETSGEPISVTSISLNKTDITLSKPSEEAKLNLTAEPAGADYTAVWKSSDEGIATVNQSGLVTAVSNGTVNVTATVNGLTATCIVRVKVTGQETSQSTLTINKTDITISIGESAQLTVSGAVGEVTWKSSNNGVAVVGNSGLVTGISVGTVTVTATTGSSSVSCIVRVK